jgi:diaminohydroxyphosphoribosylaminopyrimidine deaminase/5-amino-6-(5-phosphoribosylamino)uracil reductase
MVMGVYTRTRSVTGKPLGILKYAMTLDGKIACASGHSAWVSNSASRALVFKERARSDAVIVGGNTVRKDGPRLTTRVDHGHAPIRVVRPSRVSLARSTNDASRARWYRVIAEGRGGARTG